MESSEKSTNDDTSWSTATNWTVASGSLVNSVTFESSLSIINDDNEFTHDQSSSVDSTSKSPLILYSSSPDSTPCEITIIFAQKHELRQVYIRSTARVYEIYYAPELQSSSEYLCTVRCGIASRDEEVLQSTGIEEAVVAHLKGSTKEPAEEKLRTASNLTTNEDDWVEVKVLDAALLVSRNSSLSSSSDANSVRRSQDLYEATAEITDANPCMSLTLRLLSLQNKGCACVEEVYVFSDPIDTATLDNQVGPMENAAGSSLMAMLVPTLLQLSKSKGMEAQDKCSSVAGKQKTEKIEPKPTDPTDFGKKIQLEGKSGSADPQEVKLQEAAGPRAEPVQLEIPSQVPDTEGKPGILQSCIEGVLEQLVSRVNRIEDLFLRFEEHMLKPIRNIDHRLQRVEQQLEALAKKTENSGLLSCTRISAPEFSCTESEANSFYNSGSVDLGFVASEANKNESHSVVLSIPSDTTVSANATKLHPSLVVTAPEFSNCDDDEDNHTVEAMKESPKYKSKNTMSIDNALASALAGLLSSTSIQSKQYSRTLSVKAPEFPSEEEKSNDKTALPRVHSELNTDPSIGSSEPDGTEHTISSFSSLSNNSSLESDMNAMTSLNDNSVKTDEGCDEQWQHSKGEEGGTCIVHSLAPVSHDITRTDSFQMTDDIKNGEVADGTSNISILDNTESVRELSENQADNGSDTTLEGSALNELIASTEVTEEGSNQDIVQNVVEFSRAASQVDFETPILEVKFITQENLNSRSPLEALLDGTPDLNVEVPSVNEAVNDGSEIDNQLNLLSVGDWEAMDLAAGGLISVDMDYYNLRESPLQMEPDKVQECHSCNTQEMPAASLI